jgi:hypothetical protein
MSAPRHGWRGYRGLGFHWGIWQGWRMAPPSNMDSVFLLREVSRLVGRPLVTSVRMDGKKVLVELDVLRAVVRGHQLRGYRPPRLRNVYLFPYDPMGRVLSEESLRDEYPLAYGYLVAQLAPLASRSLAEGCPWYATFPDLPYRPASGSRVMSSRITSGGGFGLIDDSTVLGHNSVVIITMRGMTCDPYYILGVLNSKVFSRYMSLTMPPISAGRHSLRLTPLRRFPIPHPVDRESEAACQRIAALARDLSHRAVGRTAPDKHATIESEVARLYGLDPY